jgi:hypothetical protein
MTFNNYLLCTDEDLIRSIGNLRIFVSDYPWARIEIQKLQAELQRRASLQRTANYY